MTMHYTRTGRGKPLLLVHGLGATCDSWDTISPALSQVREVIAVDLPGHGKTREEADSGTFEGLVRSLDEWLGAENFTGVDMVGSSLGARLVLEMARRGRAGAVVALDSGGFWQGWERTFFKTTITLSVALVRALRPALSAITGNVAGRTALMAQLSARPWALDGAFVARELKSLANTRTVNSLVKDLADGAMQEGPAKPAAPLSSAGHGRIGCVYRSRRIARSKPSLKRLCTGSSVADTSRCGISQRRRFA